MKTISDWHRRQAKIGAFHRNPAMVIRRHKPKPPKDDGPRPPRRPFTKWVPAHHRWDFWKKDWIVVQGHWAKRNIRAALDIITPTPKAAIPRSKCLLLLEAELVVEMAFKGSLRR